jgi:hypothetical protein
MRPLDSNDYRRRVLATVHARGGAEQSDPFEIYDISLDEADTLDDAEVAAHLDEVWAFWQRNRDHPRYRGVILGMLARHDELAPALASRASRLALRDRVAAARAARDDERFAALDAAVARLVERFGGLPEDKLAGLRSLAAAGGIDEPAFATRIRRYRVLPPGAPERSPRQPIAPQTLRQVRADLDELGRITGAAPPRSLFDLLGVAPGSSRAEILQVRDAMAARNRQRRPDRRRALVDDLLAAVTALLVDGDPEAYLDALAAGTTERLRPRVAAAVLVEDRLLPREAAALVAEAEADGLDPARARAVVVALAREHGAEPAAADLPPITARSERARPAGSLADPVAGPPGRPPAGGDWRASLSRARAALRAGRPIEASDAVTNARELAGETLPPIRAVGDEVEAAIRAAAQRWREVVAALAARRYQAAGDLAGQLARTAFDVPGPDGHSVADVLALSRDRCQQAAALVADAREAAPGRREDLLHEALDLVADCTEAQALLAATIEPPGAIEAVRRAGSVLVSWQPSATGDVRYRVLRIGPEGARAIGVTPASSLEDGGVPADVPLPVYEVSAGRGGAWSRPVRSAVPGSGDAAVAGSDRPVAATAADTLAPAADLRLVAGRLQWIWPEGCTEMMVVWRADGPPVAADDPAATVRKVTNTRYEIDGGVAVPASRPLHVAVFGCVRVGGRLVVAATAAPSARQSLA